MPKKSPSKSKLGIMAFDVSFHRTGWAQFYNGKLVDFGALELPKEFIKVKSNDLQFGNALRWLAMTAREVSETCDEQYDIHLIAIEDLNCRFMLAAKTILQAQAAVKIGATMAVNKSIVLIHNKQAKSLLKVPNAKRLYPEKSIDIGKKLKIKPVKVICVDAVNEMYGLNLTYREDDEADAISLAQVLHNQVIDQQRKRNRGTR